MKLEDQVTSLELSKKLKELGVKQDAFWSWYEANDYDDIPRLNRSDEHCPVCTLPKQTFEDKYSAFTVAELGEMLPQFFTFTYQRDHIGNLLKAVNEEDGKQYFIRDVKTEADARAKMLIYLIENKLITI